MKTLSIRTDTGHFGWHAYAGDGRAREWATHTDERTAAWKVALTSFYGPEPKGGRLFTQAVSIFVVATGPHLWQAIQLNPECMNHDAMAALEKTIKAEAVARKNHRRNIARILPKHRTL